MLITPDFSKLKDPLTPGTYKVLVKQAEIKTWGNGTNYVEWTLATYGEDKPQNNGRTIKYRTNITGGGAFTLRDMYFAAMNSTPPAEFDTDSLLGKQIGIEVVDGVNHSTGELTGYPEVKKVKSLSM